MIKFEEITASRQKILQQLEKKLDLEFKNIKLLNNALTHTSYSNEKGKIFDSNERLEFLGDAVLELASSTYLFENFTGLAEGELTKIRASIVCQQTLAKLATKLDIGQVLLLGHGEEMSGGRTRTTNLEDTFEAIIGAIYLDSGWETAKDYVIRQLAPEFEKVKSGNNPKDFKSRLQEVVQKNPSVKIEYVELNSTGPDHMKIFECAVKLNNKIFGKGTGKTKKAAEQMAAQNALEKIENSF